MKPPQNNYLKLEPGAWRPIALLSTLGKVIDVRRMVAALPRLLVMVTDCRSCGQSRSILVPICYSSGASVPSVNQ